MKTIKSLKIILVFVTILFTGSAVAYGTGSSEQKCKKPRFRSFSPAEQVKGGPVPEVEAEATVGFWVSGFAEPISIRAEVKGQKLKLNVVNKQPYYRVTIKLPATLNGKYARINIQARVKNDDCVGKDGWLIKVKKAGESVEPAAGKE